MQDRLVFLIGSPRSGSTLLSRVLGAHPAIFAPEEPHLITPLAHLGYYDSVGKQQIALQDETIDLADPYYEELASAQRGARVGAEFLLGAFEEPPRRGVGIAIPIR